MAIMSARGIMTSPTRRSRSPRMFLSIRLSSGEKPDSPGLIASRMFLRSARTVFDFQPNSERNVRINQFSPSLPGTGTGKLRGSNGVPPAELELDGSLSGMAGETAPAERAKAGAGQV